MKHRLTPIVLFALLGVLLIYLQFELQITETLVGQNGRLFRGQRVDPLTAFLVRVVSLLLVAGGLGYFLTKERELVKRIMQRRRLLIILLALFLLLITLGILLGNASNPGGRLYK